MNVHGINANRVKASSDDRPVSILNLINEFFVRKKTYTLSETKKRVVVSDIYANAYKILNGISKKIIGIKKRKRFDMRFLLEKYTHNDDIPIIINWMKGR